MASELVEWDEVLYQGRWYYVANNYLHPRSPSAKLSLLNKEEYDGRVCKHSVIPLYVKMGTDHYISRRTKELKSMIHIQHATQLAQHLKDELVNYLDVSLVPNDSDGKIRMGAFSIPKDALQKTMLTELKATHAKLGEALKKF